MSAVFSLFIKYFDRFAVFKRFVCDFACGGEVVDDRRGDGDMRADRADELIAS